MALGEPDESGRGRPAAASYWTAANALTALRLGLAPVVALALVRSDVVVAALVYALAVGTDLADGWLARHRDEVTPAGGLFDHATDAVFVASGLAALAHHGLVPGWLPALLLTAFVQYTLDSKAVAGRPLRASRLGRWNGIAYFVALGTPIIRDALGLSFPTDAWILAFGWLLVATTLLSMADRTAALLGPR